MGRALEKALGLKLPVPKLEKQSGAGKQRIRI
jgi:hypothetical protein